MISGCMVRSWCATQRRITLSSCVAESHALNAGVRMAYGRRNLLKDMGLEAEVHAHTDAASAASVVHRRGSGRLRQIELDALWLQQELEEGRMHL